MSLQAKVKSIRPDNLSPRKNTLSGNRSAWITPCGRSCGQLPSSRRASSAARNARSPCCSSSARGAGASDRGRPPEGGSALGGGMPEILPGEMHLRQRLTDAGAMRDIRLARPYAFEKIDDRRRPPGQRAERRALFVPQRLRTTDAMRGQMRHQVQEEWQIIPGDALFIERQNERTGAGVQQEIGVLDALGDALVGQQFAELVTVEKLCKLVGGDVGIHRHWIYAASGRSERGNGKNSFSSAAETAS